MASCVPSCWRMAGSRRGFLWPATLFLVALVFSLNSNLHAALSSSSRASPPPPSPPPPLMAPMGSPGPPRLPTPRLPPPLFRSKRDADGRKHPEEAARRPPAGHSGSVASTAAAAASHSGSVASTAAAVPSPSPPQPPPPPPPTADHPITFSNGTAGQLVQKLAAEFISVPAFAGALGRAAAAAAHQGSLDAAGDPIISLSLVSSAQRCMTDNFISALAFLEHRDANVHGGPTFPPLVIMTLDQDAMDFCERSRSRVVRAVPLHIECVPPGTAVVARGGGGGGGGWVEPTRVNYGSNFYLKVTWLKPLVLYLALTAKVRPGKLFLKKLRRDETRRARDHPPAAPPPSLIHPHASFPHHALALRVAGRCGHRLLRAAYAAPADAHRTVAPLPLRDRV